MGHDKDGWADRKRGLTVESTARWAGATTKATHEQWGLARRAQAARIRSLTDGIPTIRHRLLQELGAKGAGGMPGGYRSRGQWFPGDAASGGPGAAACAWRQIGAPVM